jgi:hypothetical protein
MGLSIDISGRGELAAALAAVRAGIEDGAVSGQLAAAEAIAEDWRADAPVDTGEYADSIEADEDGAFATAPHAVFVWFGTSTHAPQPSDYAITKGEREMPETVADEITKRIT